jgi:isochorismate synthase
MVFDSTAHSAQASELLQVTARPAFFFSGPTKTLLAEGQGELIATPPVEREALLAAAEGALRPASAAGSRFVVGAVPFAETAASRLFCPERVHHAGRWWSGPAASAGTSSSVPAGPGVQGSGEHEGFARAVAEAVVRIQRGELRKVVLSRKRQVSLQGAADVPQVLRLLHARNPHGFTYALSLGEQRTLIGASPELLISRRGERVVSTPLAGSIPRSSDPQEDRERAAGLLRSAKDRHEHHLVVDQILESLRPHTRELRFEREPVVTATARLWHLSTRIEGTLRDSHTSSLRLALSLHPTPAVCGTPTALARAFIAEHEGFDRGYFTGTLGYMDATGDGDWIVTIRCAELGAQDACVFAGAGIVGSSVPELELAETDAKMGTMLDVLGWEQPS